MIYMKIFLLLTCLVMMCGMIDAISRIDLSEQPANLTVSGTGPDVEFVTLDPGLAIFKLTKGPSSGCLNVDLLHAERSSGLFFTCDHGPFTGSTAEYIKKSGMYAINIDVSANWTLEITQLASGKDSAL